jgi:hypothetical protein
MSPGPLRKAGRFLKPLLLLGPVVILLDRLGYADQLTLFVLAAAALVPLSWLIGEATDNLALHTGSGHRRLPECDVRQRAGADHCDRRDLRRPDRGRARVAGGLDCRQPPARPRLHVALRTDRRDRSALRLRFARAGRPRHRSRAHPGSGGFARGSGPPLARRARPSVRGSADHRPPDRDAPRASAATAALFGSRKRTAGPSARPSACSGSPRS